MPVCVNITKPTTVIDRDVHFCDMDVVGRWQRHNMLNDSVTLCFVACSPQNPFYWSLPGDECLAWSSDCRFAKGFCSAAKDSNNADSRKQNGSTL